MTTYNNYWTMPVVCRYRYRRSKDAACMCIYSTLLLSWKEMIGLRETSVYFKLGMRGWAWIVHM